jgi:hypothetical protein
VSQWGSRAGKGRRTKPEKKYSEVERMYGRSVLDSGFLEKLRIRPCSP